MLPTPRHLRARRGLRRLFGELLHDPNLWHLNRYSVARGVSVGLFVAFVPVPFQMAIAAALAILASCNLPVAVAFVWVSNPLTIPPLFFAAYELGAWLLDVTPRDVRFELSLGWLLTELGAIWRPFLLGCLLLGAATAAIGQVTVRVIWRIHVIASWRERARRRLADAAAAGGARTRSGSTQAAGPRPGAADPADDADAADAAGASAGVDRRSAAPAATPDAAPRRAAAAPGRRDR